MKILIAYDGSECADAALDDLRYAGLPEIAEALVLSVGEIASELPNTALLAAGLGYYFPDDPRVAALHDCQLRKAQMAAVSAADHLRARFPKWHIETEGIVEMPESAIVQKASSWGPDLIVMGSHGRSGFRRFMLGSVSQKVMNQTHCSIRIGRCHPHEESKPLRIVFGTDGSPDAASALLAISARQWPAGTEVRVISALDSRSWLVAPEGTAPDSMDIPVIEEELRSRASENAHFAARYLATYGLRASPQVLAGNPGNELVAEAERWNGDCIFVGARGLNAFARVCLGSISNMVATRAHCSVEIVRGVTELQ